MFLCCVIGCGVQLLWGSGVVGLPCGGVGGLWGRRFLVLVGCGVAWLAYGGVVALCVEGLWRCWVLWLR